MAHFDYTEAFCRNIGVVTEAEQATLKHSCVAVAGIGGLGSIFAHTYARLGVGHFKLADGDTFQVANFNRQLGGTVSTVGMNKARAVQQQMNDINPEAKIEVWEENLDDSNMDTFLQNVDLVLNEIELFEVSAHRMLFREARARGRTVLMAAPMGFTGALLTFTPDGMSAEEYFDWNDDQNNEERLARFVLGLAPRRLHHAQIDLRYVDADRHLAPSNILACFLCAGLAAMEGIRFLTGRSGLRPVPYSFQFDPYTRRTRQTYLRRGNRSLLQRFKIRQLLRNYQLLRKDSAEVLKDPLNIPEDTMETLQEEMSPAPASDRMLNLTH